MSNAEYNSWLWRWFKGWAIATAIIIVMTQPCHAYGMPFFSGSSWLHEGNLGNSSTQGGVTAYGNTGTATSGFWSMFARWMY